MRPWRKSLIVPALAFVAAPAAADDGPPVPSLPAPAAAIVAGGKACIGTTIDAAGQAARIAGWASVTGPEKDKFHTDGDVVQRDNVMLIYKNGIDGGCVIVAKPDAALDTSKFYADLGSAIGTPIPPGDGKQPPIVNLPNGELIIVVATPTVVTLVIANQAGKHHEKEG
jgi:hypothetical protein